MSRELTNLLHLRTVAIRNFGIAFRAGVNAEEFRDEIDALRNRIRVLEQFAAVKRVIGTAGKQAKGR